MTKIRAEIEMIRDIVEYITTEPKIVSKISRDCNTNYVRLIRILKVCKDKGLITEENGKFKATHKGFNFVKLVNKAAAMLRGNTIGSSSFLRKESDKEW